MRIGEVAQQAGVTVDTVRFYERRGVLPEPERRPSGYRTYAEGTVERIRLARDLQGLGFTLAEVADALRSHDSGEATCESERWRIEAVLSRIEAKIAELQAVRAEVGTALRRCDEGRCRFVNSVS
jgi:DNA-binding transcriptional MerR regulator